MQVTLKLRSIEITSIEGILAIPDPLYHFVLAVRSWYLRSVAGFLRILYPVFMDIFNELVFLPAGQLTLIHTHPPLLLFPRAGEDACLSGIQSLHNWPAAHI